MRIVHCTCILHIACCECVVYSVYYTLYRMVCAEYNTQYTLYVVYYTIPTAHCRLYNAEYKAFNTNYTLYIK